MRAQLHVVVAAPWCAQLNHKKRSESEKFQGPGGRSGGEPYSVQIYKKNDYHVFCERGRIGYPHRSGLLTLILSTNTNLVSLLRVTR